MTAPELRSTWDGPTVPTAAGVELPACELCRRRVLHNWTEHVAEIGEATDPLARTAGMPEGDAAA